MSYWDSDPAPETWHLPQTAGLAFNAFLRPLLSSVFSARRCALYAVACCRLVQHTWSDPRVRAAVDAAERFADCKCLPNAQWEWDLDDPDGLNQPCAHAECNALFNQLLAARAALEEGEAIANEDLREMTQSVCRWPYWQVGSQCSSSAQALLYPGSSRSWESTNGAPFSDLLREVFPDPFHPVTFLQSWRTDTTLAIAAVMYESRDFTGMPILADALQDAGCDEEQILLHCRGPGPHVRGCWAVDLVLGKA